MSIKSIFVCWKEKEKEKEKEMDARLIFDDYEQECDFEKLKQDICNASEETLWGRHGILSCLIVDDNELPQLLRVNYEHRFELLVILMRKKLD